MGIEAGDVFYTKTARNAPASKKKKISYIEHGYKGHVLAFAIGYIPPDGDPATQKEIYQLLASIGLFSGDDIIEVLGEKAFNKLMTHVEKKYS